MDFLAWVAAIGSFLLFISLTSGWINRSLFPLFGVYLLAGIICGPAMLALLHIDVLSNTHLIERITEIAIAISLFLSGLKIRFPITTQAGKTGMILAIPVTLLTILGITIASHVIMGLSWPLSLAFAAIIAPTDPVLGSLITVRNANDDDSLRLTLSIESGFNDAIALSFLMLAIFLGGNAGEIGLHGIITWLFTDVVWSLFAGLVIGYGLGYLIGFVAARLRHSQKDIDPCDFLTVSLICLSYAFALMLDASGFLATFAAGIGMRSAEFKIQQIHSPENSNNITTAVPLEMLANPHLRHSMEKKGPLKFMGLVVGDALIFGDTAERFFAAILVVSLGAILIQYWELNGLFMAIIIFCFIRPISVFLSTWKTSVARRQKFLTGWLGIRGMGSINAATYAYTHGIIGADNSFIFGCVITVVAISVLLHGITVTPLLNFRDNYLKSKKIISRHTES